MLQLLGHSKESGQCPELWVKVPEYWIWCLFMFVYVTASFVKTGCLGTEFLGDHNKLSLEITLFVVVTLGKAP